MLINSNRGWPQANKLSLSEDKLSLSQNKVKTPTGQETYLHNLLSDVAGRELHREGLHLSVECEKNDQPFELQGDKIVVDPDVFHHLDNKEEVAFFLAQKAAFAIGKGDSEGMQFGADRMAISMLAEAGINPSGAYSGLEKLYQAYPSAPEGEGLSLAFKTVASGREHEGVRLAVAQVEVEQLRRKGHPSTKKAITPLPGTMVTTFAPTVRENKPSLQGSTNLESMIDRAFDRLQGKDHQTKLDGVLEAVMLAAKHGKIGSTKMSPEASDKIGSLATESTTDGEATELHKDFLQTLVSSDSLKGLLHPLNAPWQNLISGVMRKRGRLGLPEGMLVLNQVFGSGQKIEVPEGLDTLREDLVTRKLQVPYKNPQDIDGVLKELFNSQSWAKFSPEFEERLPHLLLDVVRTSANQPGFQTETGEPSALHPAMERRLGEMLNQKSLPQSDRKAITQYLFTHLDTDRSMAKNDPRRAVLAPVVANLGTLSELSQNTPSPNNESLRQDILAIHSLTDAALPSIDLGQMESLAQRAEAGEFTLQKDNFLSPKEFRKARRQDRREDAPRIQRLKFASVAESRQTLAPLALLGDHPESLAKATQGLKSQEFVALLDKTERAVKTSEVLQRLAGETGFKEHVGIDVGKTLMTGWLAVQDQVEDLEQWHQLTERTIKICSPSLEACQAKKTLGPALEARLNKLKPEQRSEWFRKPYVSHLISREQSSSILMDEMAVTSSSQPQELATKIAKLDEEFSLQTQRPGLFSQLRNEISKKANLQPDELDTVFPANGPNKLEIADALSTPIAGLSGLLALTRERPATEQLKTIEYVMGRNDDIPEFLDGLSDAQGYLPLTEMVQGVREGLRTADLGLRIVVADSFLAGPSGLMRQEGGSDVLLKHFLKDVRPQEMDLVSHLAKGVLESQGDADTLAIAAVLAQPVKEGQSFDEGKMLSSFFDAYGVPGIKIKQYLAFTSGFEKHAEAFASAQDNAMPVNHYQALRLLNDRFGGEWPEHLSVEKILGNGSVNVAIRCHNSQTGEKEIVSVNRRDVQKTAEYDFERFKSLFGALTKTPEDQEKFGFVLGLMDVIKKSIDLEFDREASMRLQKQAFGTYNHKIDGWNIRSIDAYRAESQSLFMEEAKGMTARKLKKKDPALYKKAMTAMHKAEMAILRGQPNQGDVMPQALFANPDFHDGQVMVDTETKSVTILDFGQAVAISNEERSTAFDLLTVFAGADSAKRATKRLNARFFDKSEVLTTEELTAVIEKPKMMGRFIHLLALLSEKNAEVPISSVHWILGMNRQISLGKRLGTNVEAQVKTMVASHKLGVGLGTANTLNAISRSVGRLTSGIAGLFSSNTIPDEAFETKAGENK